MYKESNFYMEEWNFIFTAISAIAATISAVFAIIIWKLTARPNIYAALEWSCDSDGEKRIGVICCYSNNQVVHMKSIELRFRGKTVAGGIECDYHTPRKDSFTYLFPLTEQDLDNIEHFVKNNASTKLDVIVYITNDKTISCTLDVSDVFIGMHID